MAELTSATARLDTDEGPSSGERARMLWLTNVSHGVNHFEHGMLSVLYIPITEELGIDYLQLGVLTAIRNMLTNAAQGVYGFLTPFFRRTRVLGLGNFVLAIGVFLSGLAGSFTTFVGARSIAAAGSSPQHPMGASLLSQYFPKKRATILSFHTSFAGLGNFIAPLAVVGLLYFLNWRQVFFAVAVLMLGIGFAYMLIGERRQRGMGESTTRRAKLAQGWGHYRRVLKNRNMLMVALVMMVGAAGRGGGVNDTYLTLHFYNDFGFSVLLAGVAKSVQQAGGLLGPIGFGWLSDRLARRKSIIQVSLALSAVTTLWLGFQGSALLLLMPTLFVYGIFTHSRLTLTQALVADSVTDAERDAAFSLFYFIGFISGPIWAIVVGFLMERYGFSTAFSILAFSYVGSIALMFFVKEPRPAEAQG